MKQHLVVPYTLIANDMRFATPQEFNSGVSFRLFTGQLIFFTKVLLRPRVGWLTADWQAGRRIRSLENFINHARTHSRVGLPPHRHRLTLAPPVWHEH